MPLQQPQLDDLVRKLEIYAGTECTTEQVLTRAFDIYQVNAATTSTVSVNLAEMILTTDGIPAVLPFTEYPTMDHMLAGVAATNGLASWETRLWSRPDRASSRLRLIGEVDALGAGNTRTMSISTKRAELVIEDIHDRLEHGLGTILSYAATEEVTDAIRGVTVLRSSYVDDVLVYDTMASALNVSYDGTDVAAWLEVGKDRIQTVSDNGKTRTRNEYLYGELGTTDVIAATIDAEPDWSATSLSVHLGTDLQRTTRSMVGGGAVTLEAWEPTGSVYTINHDAGIVEFPYGGTRGPMRIRYTAGWHQLPQDVELVILEGAKSVIQSAARDLSLTSERLGDYAYTVGGAAGEATLTSAVAVGVRKLFSRYQRVLV